MADSKGMIDITGKEVTVRTAKAAGSVLLGPEAFDALRRGECPKGDVLATAKVAAIQAVKSTPALIPMCHPILIEGHRGGVLAGRGGRIGRRDGRREIHGQDRRRDGGLVRRGGGVPDHL